ncbi:uncharacterized protein LOC126372014 [Pectinophora gossypiella]|uniref:uncharacterized protein LOC126372014 n=1 Tax=Pectinophora gossypiella TaxID=13191 RepID=UPI00214EA5BD|nr:uncharacterized protein LOC126372014 [Pectinophora gossypiella]
MCYIFNCFAWALDFLQRAVTFVLACVLFCVMGLAVIVAIGAGVAYGYNYSMAEFLTFTRQDTTVYMRRGQFYDKPDFDADREMFYRRSGGGEGVDTLAMNKSIDYQDAAIGTNAKALPDTWGQIKDTRKYAEVLTKFSRKPDEPDQILKPLDAEISKSQMEYMTTPVKRVSMTMNPSLLATTLLQSGSSQIIMRNFKPPHPETTEYLAATTAEDERQDDRVDEEKVFYEEDPIRTETSFRVSPTRRTLPSLPPAPAPDDKTRSQKPYVPMRHWGPQSGQDVVVNDYSDDVDEDSVVYKPV